MNGGRRVDMHETLRALSPPAFAAVTAAITTTAVTALDLATGRGFDSLNAGIAVGLVAFVLALAAATITSAAFPPRLPYESRRAVVRSVHRGEAPTDPALAPAVVAYASSLRRRSLFGRRNMLPVLAAIALPVILGATKVASGQWDAAGWYGLMLVTVLWPLPSEPRRQRRAAVAEEAARGLLNPG